MKGLLRLNKITEMSGLVRQKQMKVQTFTETSHHNLHQNSYQGQEKVYTFILLFPQT